MKPSSLPPNAAAAWTLSAEEKWGSHRPAFVCGVEVRGGTRRICPENGDPSPLDSIPARTPLFSSSWVALRDMYDSGCLSQTSQQAKPGQQEQSLAKSMSLLVVTFAGWAGSRAERIRQDPSFPPSTYLYYFHPLTQTPHLPIVSSQCANLSLGLHSLGKPTPSRPALESRTPAPVNSSF